VSERDEGRESEGVRERESERARERERERERERKSFVHYLSCLYGVATISRLLQNIGLFCKRALPKRPIFSKETYNFKEPTNRSHPIPRPKRKRDRLCVSA